MNNNNNNRGNANNSNSNNNRRRGRGNRPNNPGGGGGGGGGQQLNRIDSRARGNAPQLLEKYRKLAQDAHLNGDRVQAEYFLQFADHYFRVSADTRVRQEEQRVRRDDGWKDDGTASDVGDDNDFTMDGDFPGFEQPAPYQRREREDRPPREDRLQREDVPQRDVTEPQRAETTDEVQASSEPAETPAETASANPYEPPENPFVRGTRGLRPRREDRRPRQDAPDEPPATLDLASLPPAIARSDAAPADDEGTIKPRRGRPRKPRSTDDAGGEALETVG